MRLSALKVKSAGFLAELRARKAYKIVEDEDLDEI